MAAPTFVSSSPVDGATDVAKNASLSVTFDVALDATTVDAARVYLKNTELDSIVSAAVSLSSTGKVIQVVPATVMIPLSAYTLVVVGADVDATNPVKSGTSDALATTVRIAFQTADTVEADDDITGDLSLPDDVVSIAGTLSPLKILSTSPKHHAFGIPTDQEKIRIRFNKDLDPVSTGHVTLSQTAFYEEEDLRAVETDLGAGDGLKHYFRMDTADEPLLDLSLFADAPGYARVTGAYLEWVFTGAIPKNMYLEMTLGADVQATDGTTLGADSIWAGCTEAYPGWVDLRSIRHQVGSSAAAHVPDDFIGLRIWQNSVDLLQQMAWRISIDTASVFYKKLIRCQTALQVWEDLKVTSALASGMTKRLGDLTISYAATSAAVRPWALSRLQEECKNLERQTIGALSEKIATGVRSSRDAWEPSRAFFRSRLWRAELIYNDVVTPATVANTALQRLQTSM